MAYIFLDESGDLGFNFDKPKTSKYFVITLLFVQNKRPVEKIVKNVFKGLTKKQIKAQKGMLHAYKSNPKTRQKVLADLAQKDVSVMTIYLNKKKVYTKLQDEKQVLYNYVANILLDRIYTRKLIPTNETIHLVASRRETNKFLNDNFKSYLSDQVRNTHKLKMNIDIRTPQQEKCLQIVDFASWAIFRKHEHKDETYYNLIKKVIIEESPLYP